MSDPLQIELAYIDRIEKLEKELLEATHLLAAVVHCNGGEVTLTQELMTTAPAGATLAVHNDPEALTVTLQLTNTDEDEKGGSDDASGNDGS
jgi:hypothetical protein